MGSNNVERVCGSGWKVCEHRNIDGKEVKKAIINSNL